MKIFFTAALLVAVNVSLVAGGCKDNGKGNTDATEQCEEWWRKMMDNYNKNSEIKQCILLIRAKCPSFLVIEENIEIKYKVYRHSVKWTIEHKAIKASWKRSYAHYRITEKTGVCKNDYGLGNCDSWWHAAMTLKNVDHVVERCINRIKQKCPGDLTWISGGKKTKRRFISKVTEFKLTYAYRNGEEVTFRRYE